MVPATTRSFISSSDAMKKLYLKLLLLAGLVGAFIFAADRSGLFRPDMINNHELACWNAFYDFTEENDVDVLLVGNSHLYTGINPNHLSNILGANCFILASSGAPIIDTYYSLKEALKRCTPKLVVVETYGIGDKKVRELKADDLSNMYKSFTSRKDVLKKMVSTPVLFSSDNYLSAWSTSIRNHDFIYKDQDQIKKNREGKNTLHNKKSLELGRFTRFTSGITEESDKLYDELGAVVDGNDFKVNRENYMAVKKIEALCRKRGIPLVYLTVPMYHKHVANYSSWKTIVSRVINHDFKWIDLQDPYDFTVFDRDCFEDTRKENQHITGKGARICDYRLANFIIDESGVTLPDRHESMKWRGLFYNEDGYFEHYSTEPEDKKNIEQYKKTVDLLKDKPSELNTLSILHNSLSTLQEDIRDILGEKQESWKLQSENLKKVQKTFESAGKKYDEALHARWEAEKIYEQNQAGILAKDLKEGEKCPVCGSVHHPELAVLPEDSITQDDLDQLKEAEEKARESKNKALQNATAEKAVLESTEINIRQAVTKCFRNELLSISTDSTEIGELLEITTTADGTVLQRITDTEERIAEAEAGCTRLEETEKLLKKAQEEDSEALRKEKEDNATEIHNLSLAMTEAATSLKNIGELSYDNWNAAE